MFEKIFIFAYESSKMQTRNFVSGCYKRNGGTYDEKLQKNDYGND